MSCLFEIYERAVNSMIVVTILMILFYMAKGLS